MYVCAHMQSITKHNRIKLHRKEVCCDVATKIACVAIILFLLPTACVGSPFTTLSMDPTGDNSAASAYISSVVGSGATSAFGFAPGGCTDSGTSHYNGSSGEYAIPLSSVDFGLRPSDSVTLSHVSVVLATPSGTGAIALVSLFAYGSNGTCSGGASELTGGCVPDDIGWSATLSDWTRANVSAAPAAITSGDHAAISRSTVHFSNPGGGFVIANGSTVWLGVRVNQCGPPGGASLLWVGLPLVATSGPSRIRESWKTAGGWIPDWGDPVWRESFAPNNLLVFVFGRNGSTHGRSSSQDSSSERQSQRRTGSTSSFVTVDSRSATTTNTGSRSAASGGDSADSNTEIPASRNSSGGGSAAAPMVAIIVGTIAGSLVAMCIVAAAITVALSLRSRRARSPEAIAPVVVVPVVQHEPAAEMQTLGLTITRAKPKTTPQSPSPPSPDRGSPSPGPTDYAIAGTSKDVHRQRSATEWGQGGGSLVSMTGIAAARCPDAALVKFEDLARVDPPQVTCVSCKESSGVAYKQSACFVSTFSLTNCDAERRELEYTVSSPNLDSEDPFEITLGHLQCDAACGSSIFPDTHLSEQVAKSPRTPDMLTKSVRGTLHPEERVLIAAFVVPNMHTAKVPFVQVAVGSTKRQKRRNPMARVIHDALRPQPPKPSHTPDPASHAATSGSPSPSPRATPMSPIAGAAAAAAAASSAAPNLATADAAQRRDSVYAATVVQMAVSVLPDTGTRIDPDDVKKELKIGAGASGTVYAGTWRTTRVAIKEINTAASPLGEITEELSLHGRLRNEFVVLMIGYYVRGNVLAIVTEFAPMGSLDRVLKLARGQACSARHPGTSAAGTRALTIMTLDKRDRTAEEEESPTEHQSKSRAIAKRSTVTDRDAFDEAMPLGLRWRIVHDIACGMRFLHEVNMIHRDLKPGNVLVMSLDPMCEVSSCKITDFGTSRAAECGALAAEKPEAVGTVLFMSPELLAIDQRQSEEAAQGSDSRRSVLKPADVFAFGVTTHSTIVGDEPYPDLNSTIAVARFVCDGNRMDTRVFRSIAGDRATTMLTECWDQAPARRPGFNEIVKTIKDVLGDRLPRSRR